MKILEKIKKFFNEPEATKLENEYYDRKFNCYIKIKVLDRRMAVPKRQTVGSSGFDLLASLPEGGAITINPMQSLLIPTGIAIHIGDVKLRDISGSGVTAIVIPRSGLGHKHGIILGNSVGLIDSDYQGQIMVSCYNRKSEPYTINPLDRIAQIVFLPVVYPVFEQVDDFEETKRSDGGFGSTGK